MDWIKQVLLRAFYIYLGLNAIAFLFAAFIYIMGKSPNINISYTGDPFRGMFFCVLVSAIVQVFKKPDQTNLNQGRTAYQAKYSKLLNMLGGDREAADRLISAYGIDRAISDLERDRRIN